MFALKTLITDLEPLLERPFVADLLDSAEFVYLTRDDLVAQAFSNYIAESSGVWHRDPSGELFRSRGGGDPDPPYDEERILAERDTLVRQQTDWERFFADRLIEPLRITYEQFVADANATVEAIAGRLGVDWKGELSLEGAATARLADERSERWAHRFHEARGL